MLMEPGAKALFPVAMPLGLQCPSTWGFLGRPFPSDQRKLVHGGVKTISLLVHPAGLALPSLLVLSAPFGLSKD